MLVVNLYWHI